MGLSSPCSLLVLVSATTVPRSVCLISNKYFSEALYWSCILNSASKIVLEGVCLPNPVTFSRLLQKRNLKVNKNKSGIVLLRNFF